MNNYFDEALALHSKFKGKIEVSSKMEVDTKEDLAIVYSPGVAAPCMAIAAHPEAIYEYTIKGNTVAIVTDGSAVLGLGNIGPQAALPVMEGKAMLFKKFAGIDGFPICLDTQDPDLIIQTVKLIAPVFGGINLEDIAAPNCFYIEQALQEIGIPVFHDDQHGTAIVVLAGLINACKLTGRNLKDLKVVINGAGAAGIAITRLLRCVDHYDSGICTPVKEVIICDSTGILHQGRTGLNTVKQLALSYSNHLNQIGDLRDALRDADVFIGVSAANILEESHIKSMAKDPIIFALANPIPEIMPDLAYAAGAAVVATGRSDLPNQVNNVLGFPGIFRGALDIRAKSISPAMKLAAAYAIASCVDVISRDSIIPSSFDVRVAYKVAEAVKSVARQLV
ncbi:MAG: NADP-dependent malic enzyme [Saprospiraceae bacterium]